MHRKESSASFKKRNMKSDGLYTVFKQNESLSFYHRWSSKECSMLSKAVAKYGIHRWSAVASCIPGRTAVQCSTRWFGALNTKIHKGKWSKGEDRILKETVDYYEARRQGDSTLPWSKIAENIQYRTGVQCQARWTEALDPMIHKGRWSDEENALLERAVAQFGCCWIRISRMIPTRTQRQCRTRWNQMKNSRKIQRDSTFENDAYKSLTEDRTRRYDKKVEPSFGEDTSVDLSVVAPSFYQTYFQSTLDHKSDPYNILQSVNNNSIALFPFMDPIALTSLGVPNYSL
ncbi:Homeodomain-like protein [Sporodiniella umbellata]|nr:Homeodomain-like protein [Sporodiniella umbellata]